MTPPAPHGSLHCDPQGTIQPVRDAVNDTTRARLMAQRRLAVIFLDCSLTTETHARWTERVRKIDQQLNNL